MCDKICRTKDDERSDETRGNRGQAGVAPRPFMQKRTADIGLLILRVISGAIFLPHGYSKVFGSGGVAAFAHDMPGLGLPAILGYAAAYSEFFGAILLMIGLLSRLDAFLLACTMFVAVALVQLPDALHEAQPGSLRLFAVIRGVETPLSLLGATLALTLLGPGRFSLDHALRIEEKTFSLVRRTPRPVTADSEPARSQ